MLSREELQKEAATLGFTSWQAERDYLQHLFLLFLSRKIDQELIFKGGTALQKTFGLNRFSIDLDFTQQTEVSKEVFIQIAKEITRFGFHTELKEEPHKESLTIKVIIRGPLYQKTERTLTVLRIEISLREKIVMQPETKEVFPLYADLQPYLLKVMHHEEILAEKIRAIFTRSKARDVFDLRFLLQKKVPLKKSIVEKKLLPYSIKYSRKELLERIKSIEPLWKKELGQLISIVPPFSKTVQEIEENIPKQ